MVSTKKKGTLATRTQSSNLLLCLTSPSRGSYVMCPTDKLRVLLLLFCMISSCKGNEYRAMETSAKLQLPVADCAQWLQRRVPRPNSS